jgi:hypothetical protein
MYAHIKYNYFYFSYAMVVKIRHKRKKQKIHPTPSALFTYRILVYFLN